MRATAGQSAPAQGMMHAITIWCAGDHLVAVLPGEFTI
jgi:hypothetical protein